MNKKEKEKYNKLVFWTLMFLIAAAVAASLFGCSKINTQPTTFTVKAGEHRCNNQLIKIKIIGNTIMVDVYVDETWFWEEVNGISKVVGIYWIHPHMNSIRLGWDGDEFCYYAYNNGVSPQERPELKGRMFCATTGWYHFVISYQDGKYQITHHDITYTTDAPDYIPGHPQLSLPNAGGTYTLPHDWTINLNLY